MSNAYRLVALPSGRSGQVVEGTSLRTALRGLGLGVRSLCAENATCGKCGVLVEEGAFEGFAVQSSRCNVSPPRAEELDFIARHRDLAARRGWVPNQLRLACQARVQGDVVVTIPEESLAERLIVRKTAAVREIEIAPAIRKYLVELTPPSLNNPKPDWDRLASGLATCMSLVRAGDRNLPSASALTIDRVCLQSLSETLRRANWRVTVSVWQDREVIRVQPGLTDDLVGAAIDIGTTTLALYLCDLGSGNVLSTASDLNPQMEYGADVMSRIQYCLDHPDGLHTLHKALIKAVNQLLAQAASDAGITPMDVVELVVVGNTTMQHMFLDISPASLGTAPFAPTISAPMDLKSRDLRLMMNASANVHMLPGIASFIGADTSAVLIAEAPQEQDENWLIIDIGTNAELVLGNRGQLLCASTPTGPALEGAHIEHGMRAAPGAIEHLWIDADTLKSHWRLIGEDDWDTGVPQGLCGSAVVDAVAELVRVGKVDASGRLRADDEPSGRIRRGHGGLEYVIADAGVAGSQGDLTLTQNDIRQVQLAKGALFVAARSLLDRMGLQSPDRLILAGAFGSYIDKQNAMDIGMLPAMDLERVFVVGNAAGDGARIALLNAEKRADAVKTAGRITRHELPTDPQFQQRFIEALAFPAPAAPKRRPA